jgi:hypothetical protein
VKLLAPAALVSTIPARRRQLLVVVVVSLSCREHTSLGSRVLSPVLRTKSFHSNRLC